MEKQGQIGTIVRNDFPIRSPSLEQFHDFCMKVLCCLTGFVHSKSFLFTTCTCKHKLEKKIISRDYKNNLLFIYILCLCFIM